MTGTYPLHVESLTDREHQMAQAVARGLRNREIATEFGISEETVKKHLATIYGKLALSGRVALAVHILTTRATSARRQVMMTAGGAAPHHPDGVSGSTSSQA